MNERFRDIDAFYAEDTRRRFSGEVDYGVMWTDGEMNWPQYRVTWVEQTGEFYAIRLGGVNAGEVELLGKIQAGREGAERALKGWAEVEPMTLDWVRGRLA